MAPPFDDDQKLARGAHRRRPEALEQISQRLACVPAFVRTVNRRLGHPIPESEVPDVAQNVLTALWAKLDRYNGQASLESWAFGFSVREVRKAIDARRRRAEVPLGRDVDRSGPSDRSLSELESVEAEIAGLGHPAGDIVRQKHFDDLSFPEIAEALDLPLGSVKTHYYRAMARLRVRLAPLWRAVAG